MSAAMVPIFVEENGAVVGHFEVTLLGVDGAGECAFHMAEQRGFQQIGGQRAAVHGHEHAVGAANWCGWPWRSALYPCRFRRLHRPRYAQEAPSPAMTKLSCEAGAVGGV